MTCLLYTSNTIDDTYSKAYLALQRANTTLGICEELAGTVPEEESLGLSYRSVMGVEIPIVSIDDREDNHIPYGLILSLIHIYHPDGPAGRPGGFPQALRALWTVSYTHLIS